MESKGIDETHSDMLNTVIQAVTCVREKADSALSYDKLVTTLTITLLSDVHKENIIKEYGHLNKKDSVKGLCKPATRRRRGRGIR